MRPDLSQSWNEKTGRWQWDIFCRRLWKWIPTNSCPVIFPFVELAEVKARPAVKVQRAPDREWPERDYARERIILQREYPGLHDAELGLEPYFGYDKEGVPVY